MKPYESYKKTDIPWLEEVPSHWEIKRIKEVLIERKENNTPIKTTNILSLTNTRGVIPYSEKGNIGNKAKENFEAYKLAYPNDIVVNSMNVTIGSVGLSKHFGAVSPVYYMLYIRNNGNIEYFNYIFRSQDFQFSLKGLGNGILEIRMRIPMSRLNNVSVPVPPRVEQDQIVRYLDCQISKINILVQNKQKQIELLKEQKQAIINKAVTKGLDDSVPMKDSGIEWLGEVPEHWEIGQIKRIASLFNGREVESETPKNNSSFNVYGSGGFFKFTNKFLYSGEAVLFGRKGTIGKPILVNEPFWTVDTMYYCYTKPRMTNRYLYSILTIFPWVDYTTKTALPSVVGSQIFNSKISVPPLKEQHAITDYIASESGKIDVIVKETKQKIELLSEYKTSLISSVVMGKVNVSNVILP